MVRLFLLLALFALTSCSSTGGTPYPTALVGGSNYSYAVYSNDNKLLHSPIESLVEEIKHRNLVNSLIDERDPNAGGEIPEAKPEITDVYVISHGWNFTLEESATLYENYRLSLNHTVDGLKKALANSREATEASAPFEPYFIFITWGSISRPLTSAIESISPYELPDVLERTANVIDTVAFHIPSNWGETKEAFDLALGDASRMKQYAPDLYDETLEKSEYTRHLKNKTAAVGAGPFEGYDIPVSVLVDQLVRIKFDGELGGFKLHTVGHSYGGKLISLATLDACARMRIARSVGSGPDWIASEEKYVDTMVLLNPAMKISEMYYPITLGPTDDQRQSLIESGIAVNTQVGRDTIAFRPVAESIQHKAVTYSRHDSANGWAFSLSQLLLSYDALSEPLIYDTGPAYISWLGWTVNLVAAVVQTVATDVAALVLEPTNALYNSFAEYESAPGFVQDILSVPFAPFASLRGAGNQGFRPIHSLTAGPRITSWLTPDARNYLNSSKDIGSHAFFDMTETVGADPEADRWRYTTYDAKRVYNGHISSMGSFFGGILNQLSFGAAHGDVRSYDMIGDLSKRERTFRWIINLTRSNPSP